MLEEALFMGPDKIKAELTGLKLVAGARFELTTFGL